MAGFGGIPFGGTPFGGIHVDAPVVISDILVQPSSAGIGADVLIASLNKIFIDSSRDDPFLIGYDPALWSETASGPYTLSTDDSLVVTLNKDSFGSSHTLQSMDAYTSGDVSVEYEIISDLVDGASDELVYFGLQLDFSNGDILTIKRKSQDGFGHQVNVTFMSNGGFSGGSVVQTAEKSGKFRLIAHDNMLTAAYNDNVEPIFLTRVNPISTFKVSIFQSTSGQNQYISTRYKSYKSNVGIAFGSSPMIIKTKITPARILGMIPTNTSIGIVDIQAFNHLGVIGREVNGFEYPLITGQALSDNDGFNGSVQNDAALR